MQPKVPIATLVGPCQRDGGRLMVRDADRRGIDAFGAKPAHQPLAERIVADDGTKLRGNAEARKGDGDIRRCPARA